MDIREAMQTRHSVRDYLDKEITGDVLTRLQQEIDDCNRASGLNIQLILNEPQTFAGMKARLGKFRNVRNYIALVGKPNAKFAENCGYYGERVVLKAAQQGLNTCWVGLTYRKGASGAAIAPHEKLLLVIAIGYGATPGVGHKVKSVEQLSRVNGTMPDWFRHGVEAAQLAPTALNQQKFVFELNGDRVKTSPGVGFYVKVDMGIAKYHFEAAAGNGNWQWAK